MPTSPPPRPLTIRDIAHACGVSKSAVAAALAHTGRLSAHTRAEILRVAAEMGYDPAQQAVARRLAMRKSQQRLVNHMLAYFTDLDFTQATYHREAYRGIATVCHREHFAVLLTENDPYAPPSQLQAVLPIAFARGDADGAILDGASGALGEALRGLPGFGDRPLVYLFFPVAGASSVISDDRPGTYAAARHLLALGHRHFLHCYLPAQSPIVISRLAGIHAALAEAGLSPAAHLAGLELPTTLCHPGAAPHMLPVDGRPGQAVTLGADLLLPYLRAHPELTAIFCENDAMALHLWHLLHNAGLRVPDDISLIGFDDTDGMLDVTGVNHLTTIRLPLYDMGVAAAELLIGRITGQLTADELRVLPVEFIARQSTAPARPHTWA
jgi:LacI family transcriptional regulator